jgi:tetratricopeptide (TPR) repeat protein
MEFLKTAKVALLVATITVSSMKGQDMKQIQAAFAQSYIMESSKNYKGAIETILHVHNDKQYETCLRLGWLYYASQQYIESNNYYQKAVDIMPAAIEPRLGMAAPLAAINNWDQVMQVYIDILKIDPNYATVNYRLGLIYYNRQNYVAAKKYFDVYLNLFPFDFDVLNISAWNAIRQGKVDVAKALFNKALLVYPGNVDCLEGLKLCK